MSAILNSARKTKSNLHAIESEKLRVNYEDTYFLAQSPHAIESKKLRENSRDTTLVTTLSVPHGVTDISNSACMTNSKPHAINMEKLRVNSEDTNLVTTISVPPGVTNISNLARKTEYRPHAIKLEKLRVQSKDIYCLPRPPHAIKLEKLRENPRDKNLVTTLSVPPGLTDSASQYYFPSEMPSDEPSNETTSEKLSDEPTDKMTSETPSDEPTKLRNFMTQMAAVQESFRIAMVAHNKMMIDLSSRIATQTKSLASTQNEFMKVSKDFPACKMMCQIYISLNPRPPFVLRIWRLTLLLLQLARLFWNVRNRTSIRSCPPQS